MNGNPQLHTPFTWTLRDLPLAARLTLALFLISVGIGYVSALVQLHFQHATPGEVLPNPDDAVRVFHGDVGDKPKSKIEQLLPEDFQGKPFNGQGQMTAAFFGQSSDFKSGIKSRARQLAKKTGAKADDESIKQQAEREVRQEHDGERRILLAWIQSGANEKEYDEDRFPLPKTLADRAVKKDYLVEEDGQIAEPRAAKIRSILTDRCVRCHQAGGDDPKAAEFPLTSYKQLKPYVSVQTSSGMSLTKLAQTTHVHLLGFSMLYGLTGLILAFSSYPRLLRIVLCPLPLLVQMVDISFWWLGRLPEPEGPMFASGVVYTGAIVAIGLLLHIVLGLFNLFRAKGWLILILLFAGTAYVGYIAKERYIDPYIAAEKAPEGEAKESK